MSELVDDKYSMASLLIALDGFTMKSLTEKLQVTHLPSMALAVIDELLTSKYVEAVQGEALTFNAETNDFEPQVVIAYKVVPDKRDAFREYIETLNKQRFQPDAQGKPRGQHYRVVEQLIECVVNQPATLQQQEDTIISYLELAREDEILAQPDPQQKAISEAYIRTLYGRFLDLKSLWQDAILQLLTASRVFNIHGIEEPRLAIEQQACEILKRQYEQAQKDEQLDAFVSAVKKIL